MFKFVATVALAAGLVVLIPTAAEAKPSTACAQALTASEDYQSFVVRKLVPFYGTAVTNALGGRVGSYLDESLELGDQGTELLGRYEKAAKRCRAGK